MTKPPACSICKRYGFTSYMTNFGIGKLLRNIHKLKELYLCADCFEAYDIRRPDIRPSGFGYTTRGGFRVIRKTNILS